MSVLIFKQGPVLLSLRGVTQSRQTFIHFLILLTVYMYDLGSYGLKRCINPMQYNWISVFIQKQITWVPFIYLYNSTLSPHCWDIMWLLPRCFLDVLVNCWCVHGDREGFKLKEAITLKGNCRACCCQMTTLLFFVTMYCLINITQNYLCHGGALRQNCLF